MSKTDLLEFEEIDVETKTPARTIVLLVSFITCGLWVNPIIRMYNVGISKAEASGLYYLLGFTFFIGLFTFLFIKKNKAGWFLLVMFLAVFLGAAIAVLSSIKFSGSDIFYWRQILSFAVSFCILTAMVLLFHNNTAKTLTLNNWLYGFGLISAVSALIGGFFLVKLATG